ncbi:MAG: xanthine dehydrogenase molybdopterin binding subunit, partial [Pseudomonadota bacterium]
MPDTARPVSEAPALNHVHKAMRHDSADKHVSGAARYIDDLPEPPGLLHMYIAMSERAHADITMFDLSAVRSAPGVAVVISAGDVPGPNDIGPVVADDPLFAAGNVQYHGQALFAVGAESIAAARAAAKLAKITYAEKPVLVSVADAKAAGSELEAPQKMVLGDAEAAIDAA